MTKTYPAKLLLLGEHTILRGSRALAVPFPSRACYWALESTQVDEELQAYAAYLQQELPTYFAVEKLQADLAKGWKLVSTIPVGYGMGSSGAVCIAIFDRYATVAGRRAAAAAPKPFFANMENHYHGDSSGTDPLLSYLGQAVCLYPDGRYEPVYLPADTGDYQLFLLDTQQARQTAPLVAFFTASYDEDPDFRAAVDQQWISATEQGIDSWLAGNWPLLADAFEKISTFQLRQLPPMVLPSLRHAWAKGLASQRFSLKICGAGGGGYCLGLTKDWAATQALLKDWPCEALQLGEGS